jgi:hypothetical protein
MKRQNLVLESLLLRRLVRKAMVAIPWRVEIGEFAMLRGGKTFGRGSEPFRLDDSKSITGQRTSGFGEERKIGNLKERQVPFGEKPNGKPTKRRCAANSLAFSS